MSINFRVGGARLPSPTLPLSHSLPRAPFDLLSPLLTTRPFFHRSPCLVLPRSARFVKRREREESGEEKRGLGVPIRPDLIPIGCPNLSRLRASIGKSGAGTDGGDGGGETRGTVRGNGRRRGFPRAAATEESTLLIETKERKIAVETSERMNERVRVSFRFVSFRFRGARDLVGKKMSPFSLSVGFAPPPPWKSERNGRRKK